MFRAFGMVQRLQIIIVFLWSYIVPMLCYENPKLTMDLLSSGFHRLAFYFIYFFSREKDHTRKWSSIIPCFQFHRDLKYVVVFPELQGQQNTFLIKQPLPASVYVSTDQLDDLQRQDKVNSIEFTPTLCDQALRWSKYSNFHILFHYRIVIVSRSGISSKIITWILKSQQKPQSHSISSSTVTQRLCRQFHYLSIFGIMLQLKKGILTLRL